MVRDASVIRRRDATPLAAAPHADMSGQRAAESAPAMRIVERLLRGFGLPCGLRLWNGASLLPSGRPAAFTLVLHDPALLRRLCVERDPLLLVDAYVHGALEVDGDLYSALALKDHLESLRLSWRERLALLRDAWQLQADGGWHGASSVSAHRFGHRHTRRSDRAAISFHYDVSNAFYGLWLDAQRVYSCAYFESAEDTLEQAQCRKLEHICRKLRLRPDERLLDIGCGWGALVCWAARRHGVRVHGITLSRRQLEYAEQRIRAEGLQDRASVGLCDFRDLPADAVYDKVASVGMFEHVGLANLPVYLSSVRRVLRPGGLFLNHGITHDEDGWNRTLASRFINRHVFPDGELDRVSNIQLGMERAGFEIHDVEGLPPHYALTLRHWVRRLEAKREAALREVDEPTYRTWRLYMAACALVFESGGTGVYQILASRRDGGQWPVPLSRRDLYRP